MERGHPRLVRQASELVDVMRELRRVERAPVVMESGPVEASPPASLRAEAHHATEYVLGGAGPRSR